jgi:hypothetical protein
MSYEFSGNTASQTSTNPDGTSVVSTWTINRGSGLTQTDQLRLARACPEKVARLFRDMLQLFDFEPRPYRSNGSI